MRYQRVAAYVVATSLVFALIGMAVPVVSGAQDAPIAPIAQDGAANEIVLDGARFLQDIDVLADLNPMQQVIDESGATVYVKPGESDPLGAVYAPLDDGSGLSTRYFPERVGQADAVCPVEQADAGTLSGDGATYVSAGPELDYTQDALTNVGTTGDGLAILGIPGDESMTNLFVAQNNGQGPNSLIRYVMTDVNGAPAGLGEGVTFAGQEFTIAPGAVASLDGLVRVGCAGIFPLYAETPDGPFTVVVMEVADGVVSYEAVPGEEPVASPTDIPATPEPTLEATAAPTEAPIVEPTLEVIAPATPEPTASPTVEPTAEPTVEPTAVATEVPPTEEPTEIPATEAPAPDLTDAPTEAPTVEPTQEPTPAPTEVPADADLGEEPEALPTAVPPTPEPGTPEPTAPPARPTPTPRPLQPQAVVPTLPPDAPPPAAGQSDVISCAGNAGALDDNGVPERLARNLQYGGQAYRYSGQVQRADAGDVIATGCVGAFVLYISSDSNERIYLGLVNGADTLFAFEQTSSLTVQSQAPNTEQPRSLELGGTEDQGNVRYRATDPWLPSLYSSLSLEVYVADPETGLPDRLLGYSVGNDVFGEYAVEGSAEVAPQEVLDEAESLGIHPQMMLEGQRYVLVALWTPFGTTTNGWLTFYAVDGEATPDQLLGIDPRRQDLMIFNAEGQ